MKFQINETVESPDAELVSRVLETCLKAQWADVAREGSTIVLHGLGASPRVVNRSDTTVFAVKIAEGGKTAIEADVTYQASALVGTGAPQNELVQRKLYSVLELVRMDLDLAQRRAAHAAERELKPRLVNKEVAEPEPVVAEMSAVETRAAAEAELIAEAEAAIAEAGLVAKAEVATAKAGLVAKAEVATAEAGRVAKGGPAAEVAPVAEVAPAVEAPSVAEAALLAEAEAAIAEAELVARGAPSIEETPSWAGLDLPLKSEVEKKVVAAEPAEVVIENLDIPGPAPPPATPATPKVVVMPRLNRREEKLVVERSKRTKTAKDRTAGGIFTQILLLFVLAAIAQVGWQYRVQLKEWMGGQRVSWTNTPSAPLRQSWNNDPDSSAPVDTPHPDRRPVNTGPADTRPAETAIADTGIATSGLTAGEAAGQADVSAVEEAVNESKLAEPDPTMWLEKWGDALRGEDAGLQASFYADKVDKYFLKNDVSRSEVMADKEAAIQRRKGWWTLTLDDVVVAQHTETTARVLLVKHFMIDDGKAGVRDQRLPTQLRLKRIDGRWQITSEQTLGW